MKAKQHRILSFCILFLLSILCFSSGLCGESPRGKVRIYGYNETIATKGNKYAPRAMLQDVAEAKNMNLYLKYTYQKFSGYRRCWLLEVIDGQGRRASYPGNLNVYLPYPSAWSATYQEYWKWTKAYAERFDWYYLKGYARLYYGNDASAVASAGRFDSKDALRPIRPSNEFGFEIPMFHGMGKKAIMLFCDSGIDADEIRTDKDENEEEDEEDSWYDEDEEEEEEISIAHITLIFDNREPSVQRRKPLLWLTRGIGAISAGTY